MKKFRFLSLLLAGLTALSLICPALALEDPKPHAGAAIVVNGDTGEVLYDFNAYQRMYPASITKIMTSLVVLDAIDAGEIRMDTEVTVSARALDLPWDASNVDLKVGEVLTIEQLLYCDLLPSGCDSCNVLAEAVGGTIAEFVVRMNAKAEELGMEGTHFANPHGLHDLNHYSTAYDIYIMAHAAMENKTFRAIVSTSQYTLAATDFHSERTIYSTNLLLRDHSVTGPRYDKAIGIKTGNTDEAGRCLASAAVDGEGRTFYCVVLGSEYTQDEDGTWHYWSFTESKRLLEWAFENFHHTVLLNQDMEDAWKQVDVSLSDDANFVLAQPVGEIAATMPSDYDPKLVKLDYDLPTEPIEAPITAGQKLGTVTLTYQGVEYGTLDMVAMDDVERSEFLDTIQKVKDFWSQHGIKVAVIAGGVLVLLLVLFIAVRSGQNARRYRYSGGRRRVGSGSNYRGRR